MRPLEQFYCIYNEELVPHFNVNFSQTFIIIFYPNIIMLVGVLHVSEIITMDGEC